MRTLIFPGLLQILILIFLSITIDAFINIDIHVSYCFFNQNKYQRVVPLNCNFAKSEVFSVVRTLIFPGLLQAEAAAGP